jgi:iron complex outermembrane receptor protein
MNHKGRNLHARLLAGAAFLALAMGAAQAQAASITVKAQRLETALPEFGAQSGVTVLASPDVTGSKVSRAISNVSDPDAALRQMLAGTGLTYRRSNGAYLIVRVDSPARAASTAVAAAAPAAGAPEPTAIDELIVTAQKKEERIQDVPIAISAFSPQALEEQKIEGGFDLLKAIPNVTFSKSNFTSYNFSIRGIGTKAVSATTDPGVAVAFNNTALIQNRLFEQEYFDVERVEVLRGPQGTLYGRNATAGVINVISAKPKLGLFEGSVKTEVGNYQSRRATGMVNIPIIEDKLAVRLAGSFTERDGFDYNSVTKNPVNGRNLWSGRLTVGFEPNEKLSGNFVWEHFDEDDNRSRTGKQLCHRDDGPSMIGSTPVEGTGGTFDRLMRPALFSTGCKSGSLYNNDAFGTPNGLALPFLFGLLALGTNCDGACFALYPTGYNMPFQGGLIPPELRQLTFVDLKDPYGGQMQSRDLRTIASFRDPKYRAKADIFELNLDYKLTDSLTLSSQTAYNKDEVYSFQDYNRFNTFPIFNDTSKQYSDNGNDYLTNPAPPSRWANLTPGGVYCDPQLGCSKSLAGFDISQSEGTQFSQEFRLQSDFSGPLNFNAGVNYLKYETQVDYYVMYNLITAMATTLPFNTSPDITKCGDLSIDDPAATCPYIDPNPVESINGQGHNYFRSSNPYKLNSTAAFGELYWQATDTLKVTAGLRYTEDRKTFTPVPSQILLGNAPVLGGTINRGYPELPDIKQSWGEFTGRLGVDWKPALSFTDQTMVYGFYSRGYKGGGANPPSIGFDTRNLSELLGIPEGAYPFYDKPALYLTAVNYEPTFRPEFVNALEVGTKNTLMSGTLVINAGAFIYDYKDYQVSKIVDRTAVNENFDAKVWGLEFESVWAPTEHLRLNANLGYLDTRIGKGAKSIDLMNRTQDNPDWVVVKPWAQLPSNCVAPRGVVENYLQNAILVQNYFNICGGWTFSPGDDAAFLDPKTGQRYDPLTYPEINGGAGFYQDLEGNELPNSPHWTVSVGAQYDWDLFDGDWKASLRSDAYWQSQSWARVYNSDPYDKLHGWYNVNLSLRMENKDGLKLEIYAKNILDKSPITDAFLNSDDTALTTNVFTLDPRLIGLSITKLF